MRAFFVLSLTIFAHFSLFAQEMKCGEPLVNSRRGAFDLPVASTPIADEKIYESLSRASNSNIQELLEALKPFDASETLILKKLSRLTPPVIHRLPFERLQSVLRNGGLISPKEGDRKSVIMEKPFTPGLEDHLFGGHDCVFISIGPVHGRTSYGNIVFRFKPNVLKGWATPSSGWSFMKNKRQVRPEAEGKASPEDRIYFLQTLMTDEAWSRFFPLAVVSFLRNKSENERMALSREILAQDSPHAIWNLIDSQKLGYLEGKVARQISLEDVESIDIPLNLMEKALAFPESKDWKHKFRPVSE